MNDVEKSGGLTFWQHVSVIVKYSWIHLPHRSILNHLACTRCRPLLFSLPKFSLKVPGFYTSIGFTQLPETRFPYWILTVVKSVTKCAKRNEGLEIVYRWWIYCNRSREHLFYKYMHILNYIKEWLYVIAWLIEKKCTRKKTAISDTIK